MTTTTETVQRRRTGLSWSAQFYLLTVYTAAGCGYALQPSPPSVTGETWLLVTVLASAAAVAQLFVVVTPRNQSYHASPAFVVAAAILLPPHLIALVVVLQHLPEWLRERYPWFIQTFNIANYALAALAASLAFDAISSLDSNIVGADLQFLLAGLAAGVLFLVLNHLLLALVLRFARGHSLFGSGLFSFQSLSVDGATSLLGVVLAALWLENRFLLPLALVPLLLVHRTLALPKLEQEARQDPKTDLFNARHFTEVLEEAIERSRRTDVGLSLLVADLDLLRDVNNSYGHLAGDAALAGVAAVFREQLRPGDVAARFGGEEFCVLLPNTGEKEALAVAERIRVAVADRRFDIETSVEPICVTVSIGVASLPADASDARELIHRADVAAYQAKAEGRNTVVAVSGLHGALPSSPTLPLPLSAIPIPTQHDEPQAPAPHLHLELEPTRVSAEPPRANLIAPTKTLRRFVAVVGAAGVVAGAAGLFVGGTWDAVGMVVLVGLVAGGQALAVEVFDRGTISLSAVGSLAGAALFGPRAALALALAVCVVDWSAQRPPLHKTAFNCGALVLSSLASAGVFALLPENDWLYAAGGALAGAAYYAINVGLLTTVISLDLSERWRAVFREHYAWLFVHYLVYGVVAAMIAAAYNAAGLLALVVFAVPLILVRKAQLDYIAHTEASVRQLRDAAATIEHQNMSLTHANTLLRERATEAMESLAAAVDARDAYTAGHSRRVQLIAVAIGRELQLDASQLESVSLAALFHDVGKLAVPDSVLQKREPLDENDWWTVRKHPEEGARIIGHLGFLADATPAIRHHHERYDGTGYPDRLGGEEIPIAARILHVADALDSMTSSRVYRIARSLAEALEELRAGSGTQFCPRCVAAVDRAVASGALDEILPTGAQTAVA